MKQLITCGCSFTVVNSFTWTTFLGKKLPNYQHHALGRGSQGNGIISRKVIYKVNELLRTHSSEDLLVGIMWSGANRHDFFSEEVAAKIPVNMMNSHENPTIVAGSKSWVILNHHWDDPISTAYYYNFHDFTGQYIYTLEHILRTQWFLERHKINYFMTCFMENVLPKSLADNKECAHLYEQINFDKFLPVAGEFEWCLDSGIPFPMDPKCDQHPGPNQHEAFTDQVVYPWLIKNKLIKS